MLGTASEVEILRFIAILFGALVSLHAVREVWWDAAVLKAAGLNGPLTLVAKRNLRAEAFRLLLQLILLFPSGMALLLPQSTALLRPPQTILEAAWVPANTWSTVAVSMILLIWTLWAVWDRRLLVDLLAAQERAAKLKKEVKP